MARQRAIAALALSNSRDVEYAAAFALAVSGDDSRSQALASDLSRRFPEDTKVRFIFSSRHSALFLRYTMASLPRLSSCFRSRFHMRAGFYLQVALKCCWERAIFTPPMCVVRPI